MMESDLVNQETGKTARRNLNPEECRKKYHWLRKLGVDSYQADKMKTWPWPWIHNWIRVHGNLGNPSVNQYGLRPQHRAKASTPGNGKVKPGRPAESSDYQGGLYQGKLIDGEHSSVCGLEAGVSQ
jgi:hypothetical protein